jgi:hypothetical protein
VPHPPKGIHEHDITNTSGITRLTICLHSDHMVTPYIHVTACAMASSRPGPFAFSYDHASPEFAHSAGLLKTSLAATVRSGWLEIPLMSDQLLIGEIQKDLPVARQDGVPARVLVKRQIMENEVVQRWQGFAG